MSWSHGHDTDLSIPSTLGGGTPVEGETPYIQFEFDRVYKLDEMLV